MLKNYKFNNTVMSAPDSGDGLIPLYSYRKK